MPILVVPANVAVCQIDASEFPENCERSVRGSLHVRPASTLEVTEDELGVLKAKHPHIMKMFIKLGFSPFYLSLKKNILWFKKETQNV